MKKLFGLAIVLTLTLSSLASGQTRLPAVTLIDEKSGAVNAFIAEQMRQFNIPGLSLVIACATEKSSRRKVTVWRTSN